MELKYKNPPSPEELTEMMKKAFANMGYDTPEKRQEWFDQQKPIVLFATNTENYFC
jgi:hypothetical protein